MKIRVPENVEGELRIIPDDTYKANVKDIFLGKSGTGNPKITVKYIITTETSKPVAGEPSTIGEVILETMSLQEQALFNVAGLYKACTGEKLPMGDYEMEEFVEIIKKNCLGSELFITVKKEKNNRDQDVMQVEGKAPVTKAAQAVKKFAKK